MTSQVLARWLEFWIIRRIRRALPVPLGWYTRYLFRSYCRQTVLVTCGILTIALSIDLTLYLSKVLATISQWQTSWTFVYLAWYVVLRGTDFLAELLPLASFFGVFWAEIEHTYARERLIVWLSGRTPQQCMLPVLLFGLLVAGTQLALNYYLRPLAVTAMAREHLGFYGERFDPHAQPYPRWIAAGHDIVEAIVEPGDPPSLREVKIYRLDKELALWSFYRAYAAKPAGSGTWRLIDGYQWSSPLTSQQNLQSFAKLAPPANETMPFSEKLIDLNISPIWLKNDGVNARYLTNDIFSALSKEQFSPDFEFRTWEHSRWSLPLFCVAITFLATSMGVLLLAKKIEFTKLAIIAATGYLTNSLMKIFILLGEHGHVSAIVASWLIPVVTLVFCVTLASLGFFLQGAHPDEGFAHATYEPETESFSSSGKRAAF